MGWAVGATVLVLWLTEIHPHAVGLLTTSVLFHVVVRLAAQEVYAALDEDRGLPFLPFGFSEPEDVCFGVLGCFPMGAPWHTTFRPLPPPYGPNLIKTQLLLFTRAAPHSFVVATPDTTMHGSTYDGAKTTFFITHGFASNSDQPWLHSMMKALLKRFDANVFLVDWGRGACRLNYLQVASNTRVVGRQLARVIQHLISFEHSDLSRVHLIGHSLGAHVSSYAAKELDKIARITALDPAQPAFETYGPQVRLDKTDAHFVDVIHTSARPFIPLLGMGIIHPIGHVDLYLNGGWRQPGCALPSIPNVSISSLFDLAKIPVEVLMGFVSCSHGRAVEFFTASLENPGCTFWGHQSSFVRNVLRFLVSGTRCDVNTCVPMGMETVNYPARGSFDVATGSVYPFCLPEHQNDKVMEPYNSKVVNHADGVEYIVGSPEGEAVDQPLVVPLSPDVVPRVSLQDKTPFGQAGGFSTSAANYPPQNTTPNYTTVQGVNLAYSSKSQQTIFNATAETKLPVWKTETIQGPRTTVIPVQETRKTNIPIQGPRTAVIPVQETRKTNIPVQGPRPAFIPVHDPRTSIIPVQGTSTADITNQGPRTAINSVQGPRTAVIPVQGTSTADIPVESTSTASSNQDILRMEDVAAQDMRAAVLAMDTFE